jgi:hypothetical protein
MAKLMMAQEELKMKNEKMKMGKESNKSFKKGGNLFGGKTEQINELTFFNNGDITGYHSLPDGRTYDPVTKKYYLPAEESANNKVVSQVPWLRYAPAFTNMAQYLGTLGQKPATVRPQTISPKILTDRMNYTPTDSNYALNNIKQRFAGQNRALQSGSLGSSALSNLYMLQSNRDRQAAEAEALRIGEQENMQRKNQSIQFNANINAHNVQNDMQAQQYNAQAIERAKMINTQEQDALRSKRSALLSQIGSDLGNVGREQYFNNTSK